MGYITIIRTDCTHIDKIDFTNWLDSKGSAWWNTYGLTKSGEDPEQDDEADVRSFIDAKIIEFNDTGTLDNECDVGCMKSLCEMIEEYLIDKCGAKEEIVKEAYNETHFFVVRK